MKQKKILECSSRGDKRFSALYAKVKAFNKINTIENHYQSCKRNESGSISGKGKPPHHIILGTKQLPIEYLSQYYDLLWIRYLDEHPELVWFAKQFDDYNDKFKGKKTINCQADSIRKYISDRETLVSSTLELQNIIKANISTKLQL